MAHRLLGCLKMGERFAWWRMINEYGRSQGRGTASTCTWRISPPLLSTSVLRRVKIAGGSVQFDESAELDTSQVDDQRSRGFGVNPPGVSGDSIC